MLMRKEHHDGENLRGYKSCAATVLATVSALVWKLETDKGICTPHKMSFGVFGCNRDVQKLQGKDVGIIATEKGWNRTFAVTAA